MSVTGASLATPRNPARSRRDGAGWQTCFDTERVAGARGRRQYPTPDSFHPGFQFRRVWSGSGKARSSGYHQGTWYRFLPAPQSSRTARFPRSGWKQTCPPVSHRLPIPPRPVPGPANGLRWTSGAIGYRPFLGVVIAPQGTHAGFRLFTPHVTQRPFALAACYHRRHCYYGLMRQSRLHPRISRDLRLYRRPYGCETFPALTIHPSDVAATPTPEGRLRACTQLLPQPRWPSSTLERLGTFTPTVALSTLLPEL